MIIQTSFLMHSWRPYPFFLRGDIDDYVVDFGMNHFVLSIGIAFELEMYDRVIKKSITYVSCYLTHSMETMTGE